MVYGYIRRNVDEAQGLKEMREVTIASSPPVMRALAAFLVAAADELDTKDVSIHWHKHVHEDLRTELGCDFIVGCDNPTLDAPFPYCDG